MSASSLSLSGQTILVTGAARRVGSVIARRLHAEGAQLALHYRSSAQAAHILADELNQLRPGSVCCFPADLLSFDASPALIKSILDEFGCLNALINNASSFFPTPIGQIDQTAWNDLVGTNFMAPLLLTQAAAPALRAARGTVVNITDIHAERPLPGYSLYCAAKGALLTLTRALAIELAPSVRVNAVAPGPILWPEDGGFNDHAKQNILAHTLLKREGSPEDIAATVLFLLCDSPYITGQVINVDGGRTAHL